MGLIHRNTAACTSL